MEEQNELFKAGVNVKVDIPKSTWIYMAIAILLAGIGIALVNGFLKKI